MKVPTCSRCRKVSVLDPCRECATPAELEAYPLPPFERDSENPRVEVP